MNDFKKTSIDLYTNTERIIFYIRHQNFARAVRYLRQWFDIFNAYAKSLFTSFTELPLNPSVITDTLNLIMEAQQNNDYILIADYMENNILNILSTVLSESGLLDSDDSFFGVKTLQVTSSGITRSIHSMISPVKEALTLTDTYFTPDAEGYIIFGLGLGYFPVELFLRSDKCVPIHVFECDKTIYDISENYDYFTDYLCGEFTVSYDADLSSFINAIENHPEYKLIIHAPSIHNIKNDSVRARLNELFIHDSSVRDQSCIMNSNFRKNILSCNHYVDELADVFSGKDVYLIAAGPSLDKNINLMQNKPANSVILTVGAVYRKLLNIGITPDYVVFLDANEVVYRQMGGLEQSPVPLIITSTAYSKIASESLCDKYLVCQSGFASAESYANDRGYNTYETGGSVSTIAFDIAVRLGASRVITLGLDLSFTNDGKLHADDAGNQSIPTADNEAVNNGNYVSIPGYYGDTVHTTPSFELYRQWFIRYVSALKKEAKSTPQLINATEGGCYIDGMNHMPLKGLVSK